MMYVFIMLTVALTVIGYGFILFCAIRLARREVRGASLIAWGMFLTTLGTIITGLVTMMTILPNAVHKQSLLIPGFLQLAGFVCLVRGVSALTSHVLAMLKPAAGSADGPPGAPGLSLYDATATQR